MTNRSFDVAVIGAGYIGCSVAYNLAKAGLSTVLIEKGEVAAGASRANWGNVQIQDAELNHSLSLILAGWNRFETIEAELDTSIGFQPMGSLLLIETDSQWKVMERRVKRLKEAGIRAEMLTSVELGQVEPLIDSSSFLGACYHPNEGQIYPFWMIWGYLRRGLEAGLTLLTSSPVTRLDVSGGRVKGVETESGYISTRVVVLATGAWTVEIGRQIGLEWGISRVLGMAMVTGRSPYRLNNHLASCAFFEEAHGENGIEPSGVQATFTVSQTSHGNFLLGEGFGAVGGLHSESRYGALPAIASRIAPHMPKIVGTPVIRSWSAPVASSLDSLPYLGRVVEIDGLILATAFLSTVIVTPLVGEIVKDLIMAGSTEIDISKFSPSR
jgi:sarcosine oxidase subunit beta